MDRGNHYEAAVEAYLQWHRLGYVAVDETRRAPVGDESDVKSLDFIVFGNRGSRLLIDVKGRQFPSGQDNRRRVWECWTTQDDLDGLAQWERLSGPGYQSLLLFVYHLLPEADVADRLDDLWTWRDRRYLMRAVAAADYRQHTRVRSPRWGTVTVPNKEFRRMVRPFKNFTGGLVSSQ